MGPRLALALALCISALLGCAAPQEPEAEATPSKPVTNATSPSNDEKAQAKEGSASSGSQLQIDPNYKGN